MRTILYIVFLFLISQFIIKADIRYVSKTGASILPYTSWQTASDSIQKCVSVCNVGDTIIIGKGIYFESTIIPNALTVLGVNRDSTIINSTNALQNYTFKVLNRLVIKNVSIVSRNTLMTSISANQGDLWIDNCKFEGYQTAIWSAKDTTVINNSVFILGKDAFDSYSKYVCITNNLIRLTYESYEGVYIESLYSIIRNNVIISPNNFVNITAISTTYLPNAFAQITNNLISGGYQALEFKSGAAGEISNNLFAFSRNGNSVYSNLLGKFVNNVLLSNDAGIIRHTNTTEDYNLFWNVVNSLSNEQLGPNDIIADPMFINNANPYSSAEYNFYLQKYSPAIDKGDPLIIDLNGSRSDIGLFGGPFGEENSYTNFAPAAPRNLIGIVDADEIIVNWNRNTESDIKNYSIYMDTVDAFVIDSTKLMKRTVDNVFKYPNPKKTTILYFRIIATDIDGLNSVPSNILGISINGTGDDYPKKIVDYTLYQNYPNPFNPTTKIPYKLKESAHVSLLIYNIKGELVQSLINKDQNEGYYELKFDGSKLSSGIYFYKIECTNNKGIPVFSDVKKTMIVK